MAANKKAFHQKVVPTKSGDLCRTQRRRTPRGELEQCDFPFSASELRSSLRSDKVTIKQAFSPEEYLQSENKNSDQIQKSYKLSVLTSLSCNDPTDNGGRLKI
ncbi:hypothetical protein HAX54_044292 [Datura stramonium]|uniref:Uncharacterized protein n=1 Tax=Datura stramonium TaxID=4076 RepID=A0ABS8W3U0_DATST|nr:hypothetical protein [Datura stramonium]